MWHHGMAVDPGLLENVTQWGDNANRQSAAIFTLLNAR